jgi:hypothetical protein
VQLSRPRRRLRSRLRRRRKGTETGELGGTMGADVCDELATRLAMLDDCMLLALAVLATGLSHEDFQLVSGSVCRRRWLRND